MDGTGRKIYFHCFNGVFNECCDLPRQDTCYIADLPFKEEGHSTAARRIFRDLPMLGRLDGHGGE